MVFVLSFPLTLNVSKAKEIKNHFGNFLSWNFAKNSNDLNNLQNYFQKIDINSMEDVLLEEIFFEAVILDDWDKAIIISEILLNRDDENFTANFFRFFIGFLNNENVDDYLKKIQPKYLDLNFLKAIMIWKKS